MCVLWILLGDQRSTGQLRWISKSWHIILGTRDMNAHPDRRTEWGKSAVPAIPAECYSAWCFAFCIASRLHACVHGATDDIAFHVQGNWKVTSQPVSQSTTVLDHLII